MRQQIIFFIVNIVSIFISISFYQIQDHIERIKEIV